MSDSVMVIIIVALLAAVFATLYFRGYLKVWWKDKGLVARGGKKGSSMSMTADGPGSKITRGKQIASGTAEERMEMVANQGGKLTDVEQRTGQPDSEVEKDG